MKQKLDNSCALIHVTLSGNPNVGKSSIFNALTGLHQHTGNWTGKTVETAKGTYSHCGKNILITDIPGCYSLNGISADEVAARKAIDREDDVNVVVCDGVALKRNLNLFFQIASIKKKVILCVNLLDEAKKNGINIDLSALSQRLGVPVIGTCAKTKDGLDSLKNEIIKQSDLNLTNPFYGKSLMSAEENFRKAKRVCDGIITKTPATAPIRQLNADKLLTGKLFGLPIMLCGLLIIFWLTISGANYPSELLNLFFTFLEQPLLSVLTFLHLPEFLCNLLVYGVLRVVGFIVSVMLPPMAIFFPLFTLLEDSGILPRIAFNTDRAFKKCSACGKQCLTMCMGLGCNAAGVVGCRIIASKREKLIAILTNSFIPCNGRFPTLIALITIFFVGTSALSGFTCAVILCGLLLLSVGMTFLASYILSKTFLKGQPSSFSLELPPYRMPNVGKTIIHSIFDRTLFVLSRALISAVPAGIIIYIAANVHIGDASILLRISSFLDPFGHLLGLDGVIILAFILGLPANEVVIPIIMLAYSGAGVITDITDLNILKEILIANGWTALTALNVMLFSVFHWPCATTLLTIKKETGSIKYTALAAALPTAIGIILCLITTAVYKLLF